MQKKPIAKTDIVKILMERSGLPKAAVTDVLTHYHELIVEAFAQDEIFVIPQVVKLFTMVKPAQPERVGLNPFTKAETVFKAKPAKKLLKARFLKKLKNVVSPVEAS